MDTTKQGEGKVVTEAKRIELDETVSPHRMTIAGLKSGDEQKSRGIYTLDGDQLKLCARDGGDAEFPADFTAANANLLVLKRKK